MKKKRKFKVIYTLNVNGLNTTIKIYIARSQNRIKVNLLKETVHLGVVVHTLNPSVQEGRGMRIAMGSKSAWAL